MDQEIEVFGRRLRLRIEGPDSARRYSAFLHDIDRDRLLTRNPVRGRSPGDVLDRALEVAHNVLGIERVAELIVAVARELAPGATVELTEDAQAIRTDLGGGWTLAVPFAVEREEVYETEFDPESLRQRVREHFAAHLHRIGT